MIKFKLDGLLKYLTLAIAVIITYLGATLGVASLNIYAEEAWDGESVAACFSEGDGSKGSPYIISCAEELAYFSQSVNSGDTYEDKYIALTSDINLNSMPFTPIGGSVSFCGTFDGNFHTVSNLKINLSVKNAGLFGYNCGVIKNLTVKDPSVYSTKSNVGVIAGVNEGIIERCATEGGSVRSKESNVGGIAGSSSSDGEGYIQGCLNYQTSVKGKNYVGGIFGKDGGDAEVNSCLAIASVTLSSSSGNAFGVGDLSKTPLTNVYSGDCSNANGALVCTMEQIYSGEAAVFLNCVGMSYEVYSYWGQDLEVENSIPDWSDNGVLEIFYSVNNSNNQASVSVIYVNDIKNEVINGKSYAVISNIKDYLAFAKRVNGGEYGLNGYVEEGAELDFSLLGELSYKGSSYDGVTVAKDKDVEGRAYSGEFLGNGTTVKNLKFNYGGSEDARFALFGATSSTALIEGLIIQDAYINAPLSTSGVLVYRNGGRVENCSISADITANNAFAFSHSNTGIIEKSSFDGSIAAIASGAPFALNGEGKVKNCYNTADISAQDSAAGVVLSGGEIINCFSVGIVSACSSKAIAVNSSIYNCYYLNGEDLNAIKMSEEQFASGEVCYLLNSEGTVFGQNIDNGKSEDKYPNFTGDTVYKNGDSYGNEKVTIHTHELEYFSENGEIKVVCKADGCGLINYGSVKLKASEDLIYDGSEKSATVENTLPLNVPELEIIYTQGEESLISAPVNAGDYTATVTYCGASASINFTVSPKALTLSDVKIKDKVYDGAYRAEITSYALSGFAENESLTEDVDYSISSEYLDITPSQNAAASVEIALLSDKAKNYRVDGVTVSNLVIEKRELSVKITVADEISYGDEIKITVEFEDVSLISPSGKFRASLLYLNTEKSAYLTQNAAVFSFDSSLYGYCEIMTVRVSYDGDGYYKTDRNLLQTEIKINKRVLTLSFDDLIHNYDGEEKRVQVSFDGADIRDLEIAYYAVDGFPNGEKLSAMIDAGEYLAVVSYVGADGYTLSNEYVLSDSLPKDGEYGNVAFATVKAAALTGVSLERESLTVEIEGEVKNELTAPYGATAEYFSSDEEIAKIVNNEVVAIAEGDAVITVIVSKENYGSVELSYLLRVTKISVTVTVQGVNITYGESLNTSSLNVEYSRSVPDEVKNSIVLSTFYTEGDPVGEYEIFANAVSDKYSFTFYCGKLVVERAELTGVAFEKDCVTVKIDGKVVNELISDGSVEYFSSDEEIAKIVNNEVFAVAEGECIITAVVLKDNYIPVSVSYLLKVEKIPVTVTVGGISTVYGRETELNKLRVSFSENVPQEVKNSLVLSTDYKVGDPVGEYEIFASAVSDKYSFTFNCGKIAVEMAQAEIRLPYGGMTVNYGERVVLPSAETNFGSVNIYGVPSVYNAGVYILNYEVEDSENYYGAQKQFTVTVKPLNISGAAVNFGESLIYDGSVQTQSVYSVILNGRAVTYTLTGNTAINAGVYVLTVKGAGNYTGEIKAEFTVSPNLSLIADLTEYTVKSSDLENIYSVINSVKDSAEYFSDILKRCENLIFAVREGERAVNTQNIISAREINGANFSLESGAVLALALEDINSALEGASRYTEEELLSLEKERERISEIIDLIEQANGVKELIDALPYSALPSNSAAEEEYLRAKEEYGKLSDKQKELVDGEKLEALYLSLVSYTASASSAQITEGKEKTVAFVLNGNVNKLVKITVNGEEISAYAIYGGVLCLDGEYVKTLSAGEYEICFEYLDGVASCLFFVSEREGSELYKMVIFISLVIAAIFLFAAVILKVKRNKK